MRDVTSNHNFAFTLQYHTLESFIFDCQSVNVGHYITMTHNNGTGICTLYNDDFITRNRERTQRNPLKISHNDKHALNSSLPSFLIRFMLYSLLASWAKFN